MELHKLEQLPLVFKNVSTCPYLRQSLIIENVLPEFIVRERLHHQLHVLEILRQRQ